MSILERLKISLRLSTEELDEELQALLDTARHDLIRMGAAEVDCETPLGQLARITYARAYYDPQAAEFERYLDCYKTMADELRKSTHNGGVSGNE